jgi:hypothetical protein
VRIWRTVLNEGKQMAVMVKTITGASSAPPLTWNDIEWQQVDREVKQLQMRIAKAARKPSSSRVV